MKNHEVKTRIQNDTLLEILSREENVLKALMEELAAANDQKDLPGYNGITRAVAHQRKRVRQIGQAIEAWNRIHCPEMAEATPKQRLKDFFEAEGYLVEEIRDGVCPGVDEISVQPSWDGPGPNPWKIHHFAFDFTGYLPNH